jgi:general secretion pathway protein B
MSYILDALKKSEQKRQRESIPDLLAGRVIREEKKRRPVWLYFLAGALLINASLMLWWVRPWQPVKGKAEAPAMTVKQESQVLPARTPEPPAPVQPVEKKEAVAPKEAHSESTAVRVGSEPRPVPPPPAEHPSVAEGRLPDASKTQAAQKVLRMTDLPPSVQNDLPSLSISAHFYDNNPSSRLVSINGRVMHEGQEVKPGLKLEQITANGVIFSYQGYRFRMGVF